MKTNNKQETPQVEDETLADIKPQCDWIISNQAEPGLVFVSSKHSPSKKLALGACVSS